MAETVSINGKKASFLQPQKSVDGAFSGFDKQAASLFADEIFKPHSP